MAERQVVVFRLGEKDEYCIDISKVREIVRVQNITSIPGVSSFMEGIVNLRGQIVPVIDIQKKFSNAASKTMDNKNDDGHRRMIVVTMDDKHIGILVSAVSEILRVSEKNIEDAPPIIKASNVNDFICGVAKVGERLIVILDLEKIFSQKEINEMSGASEADKDCPDKGKKEAKKKRSATSPEGE